MSDSYHNLQMHPDFSLQMNWKHLGIPYSNHKSTFGGGSCSNEDETLKLFTPSGEDTDTIV